MYEVKWMPKTAEELEELCKKGIEHGFELVACNDKFCVFKSAIARKIFDSLYTLEYTDGYCVYKDGEPVMDFVNPEDREFAGWVVDALNNAAVMKARWAGNRKA